MTDNASVNSNDPDRSQMPNEELARIEDQGETISLRALLKPLASMKIAVTLLSLAMFLVLVGTLAQAHINLAKVLSQYFRCWWAWVDVTQIIPPKWVPIGLKLYVDKLRGGFWFPGGWTIGTLMTINLLIAHLLKFKVQTKGNSLYIGIPLTFIGGFLTWIVIQAGSQVSGVSETSKLLNWEMLWNAIAIGNIFFGVLSLVGATFIERKKSAEFAILATLAFLFGAVGAGMLFFGKEAVINDSGMRILWQLIQGGGVSIVLLAGCYFLFGKRAGVVLLHAGVLLIMSNELLVATSHVESHMTITQGEAKNYSESFGEYELAIVYQPKANLDSKPSMEEVVIPMEILKDSENENQIIDHPGLPFLLENIRYVQNARLQEISDENKAASTQGIGSKASLQEIDPVTGVSNDDADIPAVVFDVVERDKEDDNKKEKRSYLCFSQGQIYFGPQYKAEKIPVGEVNCQVSLRPKRHYKDYTIFLKEVRKDDYLGTSIAKNYSSEIRIVDPSRSVDKTYIIKMNNPLRFAGETFYQSGFQEQRSGVKITTLQIVSNVGWMIPYVGCMVVATGMLMQFLLTFIRFLNRMERGRVATEIKPQNGVASNVLVALVVTLVAASLFSQAKTPKVKPNEVDIYTFGQIPIVYEGRIKPLDTYARNMMRILAGRETYYVPVENNENTDEKKKVKITPAIQWLANLMAAPRGDFDDRIIKIDQSLAFELILEKRKSHLYSVNEILKKDLIKQIQEDEEINEKEREEKITAVEEQVATFFKTAIEAAEAREKMKFVSKIQEHKIDLLKKMNLISRIKMAFNKPDLRGGQQMIIQNLGRIEASSPPLLIPPTGNEEGEAKWQAYSLAWFYNGIDKFRKEKGEKGVQTNPLTEKMAQILEAYRDKKNKTDEFNKSVKEYHTLLEEHAPSEYNKDKIRTEFRYRNFAPLFYTAFYYLVPLILTLFGWLFQSRTLNRSAFWLSIVLFAFHTYGLATRIYISGRPPVTNLYSSAVFIGWAAVLAAIIMERIYQKGFGNVLGSIIGFSTLYIAHQLAGDGDTMKVLQAVLDTQFWLATHVVCIAMGYSATFAAGILGAFYIVGGFFTPRIDSQTEKDLMRMIYGSVCFAMFLSFVGTVLGGLWADDSWGRFWGWDPKENGALLIVLWNVLVLHARWDKIVSNRGFAGLVVFGNIVTAWSWFGVNELGVGLHSYGFTEGVLFNLAIFALAHLLLIAISLTPKSWWWSLEEQAIVTEAINYYIDNSNSEEDIEWEK